VPASTPAPSRTASATPEPDAPSIDAILQGESAVSIVISNPNTDLGLMRARFEVALMAADGSVIATYGSGAPAGAECCTVYHLPPRGSYVIEASLLNADDAVVSVELTILDEWIDWEDVDAASIIVEQPSLIDSGSGMILTGQAALDQPGPFDVYLAALIDTPVGRGGFVGSVDCLVAGSPQMFALPDFHRYPAPATLAGVLAYPTTVAGYGDARTPPDC
jgi:hypothetical protein